MDKKHFSIKKNKNVFPLEQGCTRILVRDEGRHLVDATGAPGQDPEPAPIIVACVVDFHFKSHTK